MKYLRLFENIDFSDIDDINTGVGCKCIIVGGGYGSNYIGYIDKMGKFRLFNQLYSMRYNINFLSEVESYASLYDNGINYDDSDDILSYDFVKNVCGDNLFILGLNIEKEDIIDNLDYYKCDKNDIEEVKKILMG
jgi:hypothetical protein